MPCTLSPVVLHHTVEHDPFTKVNLPHAMGHDPFTKVNLPHAINLSPKSTCLTRLTFGATQVFVDMTLFNPAHDLLVVMKLTVEFPASGGAMPRLYPRLVTPPPHL